MGSFHLTIREVLESSCFKGATVIAGHEGLERIVRWIHVLEVTEIGKLLSGNELILSTGIGWGENKKNQLLYLKQLMDAGASGLCVELVKYTNVIPMEMMDLANENRFPLVVFHEEVRFIDITQIINTNLMNNQYKILSDLEKFSRKLGQTLLLPNAFKEVIKLLYCYLDVQVLYRSKDEVIFFPVPNEKEQKRLLTLVEENMNQRIINENQQFRASNGCYAGQSVQILGHTIADLIIFPKNHSVNDFELLILDRCAIAISQDLLRIFYVEEQKKYKEKQWLIDWLNGFHNEDEVQQNLSNIDSAINPKGVVVCVCKIDWEMEESSYSYYLSIFKTIFLNYGLFLFSVIENKYLIFILVNLRVDHWQVRVSKALDQIRQIDLFEQSSTDKPIFGVGKYIESFHKLSESFSTAKESLQIQIKVNIPQEIFYENLHIYRLVSILHKQGYLLDYMNEYIGSVIEYDRKHNSELLHTLAILLEANGSKKEAAKRLFIVRQTLYHRLDKLKELLGEDYMKPTKRAAIEVSLYAYRYLSSTNQVSDSEKSAIQ